MVANNDTFIYFLGGSSISKIAGTFEVMVDCDRYDCSTNTWRKMSDMKYPKSHAYGAAMNGNRSSLLATAIGLVLRSD